MAGEFNEKIIGDKATVSLDGNSFPMKLNFTLNDGAPAERSANSSGLDYAFGNQDGAFVCEIEVTAPDLPTIRAFRVRSALGAITEIPVIIVLPGVVAGTTSGTFNVKVHRYIILNTSPDGFITVQVESVITSESVAWS